jgi:8-oxo-dGTP pyrophosphatase MutT (NUDIX family)
MEKQPNVAVKIIFLCNNEIMMLKHHDGVFDFPGGRMEWGESILGALSRELEEELGYTLKKEPDFFSLYNYISLDKDRHSVFLNYILSLDKKPVLFSPEKLEILWLTKSGAKEEGAVRDDEFLEKIFGYRTKG